MLLVLEPAERIWYHTGMILFHGSNQVVESPCLMPKARALDFGQAFYLTTDFSQAAKWAKTAVLRRGEGVATVSSYSIDEARLAKLQWLKFDGPTAEWLRFVSRNRIEDKDDSEADVVSGPVANDNTMPVLNLFFKGAYTESEALQRLLPQRLRDQFAFKTELAISCLSFKEAVTV